MSPSLAAEDQCTIRISKLWKGIMVSLASSLLFVLADILQAYGNHNLTSWQILFYRGIAQTGVMFVMHAFWSQCSRRRTSFITGSYTRIDDNEVTSFMYFFLGPKENRLKNLTQVLYYVCQ